MYLFSLPYTPGISDVIAELPVNQINDIYFSDNEYGSARSGTLTSDNLAELYAIRAQHPHIKLHYLINGNYYSNEFYEVSADVIKHVTELDVDIITLNNTYIMNDPGFMAALRASGRGGTTQLEIKNSVNNIVKTVKDVKFMVEVLGITSIIVDRALNRDIDELTKIHNYCGVHNVSITVLVNEACIVDCKWKNFDDMMIAQTTEQSNMKVIRIVHEQLGCSKFFQNNPAEYLKTGFTLPTDLDKFSGLVDVIKLAGRNTSLDKWLLMCKAYMTEDGNVPLMYLFATRPSSVLFNVTPNDLMDVGFADITRNCKNVCGNECTLCNSVINKVLNQ